MLGRKVALGAIWLVMAKLATRSLDLLSMMIVARLLVPADFGLFSLAAGVLLIFDALTDLSLSNAIVQMKDPQRSAYDTAFTLNVIRGVILAMAVVGTAAPFASYYGDPRLEDLLTFLAIVPLVRAFVSPRLAHWQRELNFRPQFWTEASGTFSAFLVSVAIAVATRSYWALAAGLVASPVVAVVLSYIAAPYRPRFSIASWRDIIAFSSWLTLANGVNTLNWQADRFFIGSRLGTSVLGQYTVGNTLASLPTNTPVVPIMQALYSGFAKISNDLPRLRAAYLFSQSAVLAIALPISILVSVLAEPIILIALGPEWHISVVVVQYLAPVFAIQMMAGPAQSIAMVSGQTKQLLKRDLWMLAIRLPLIVIGLYMGGLFGVIIARIFSGVFVIWQNLILVRNIIGVSILRQAFGPWRTFMAAILLYGFLLGFLPDWTDMPASLDVETLALSAVVIAAGLLLYASLHILLWLIGRPEASFEGKILQRIGSFHRRNKERRALRNLG
ncbi:hypothetical protein ASG43_07105 [Aureimonas sp. Leaf454]|uniref:lipopolysaccharide biosynthesis protein n=1 Tax=Aureimonas sp. Leaf454 TaxID=1736381 RepID=UPI0006F8B0B0|nr:lipopolysaccharide biosynthesis protein [Aureimonas sp. Leaf454]KQT51004.1 hypothetical protein ASG43_07105 [Aureimonas sp. Leaf454]